MGKVEGDSLNRALCSLMSNIHDTLQLLYQPSSSSSSTSHHNKLSWDDVIKMAEQLSKHATTAGMLFTEVKSEVKAIEENMVGYFNILQGLLLLAHGSTVGAGPTLLSCIHASIKQVVDRSFALWKDCISSYEPRHEEQTRTIPQSVGIVWEACSALKKTPTTNVTAIGREMTRVAVSVKDVLHEMKELEPSSAVPATVAPDEQDADVSNSDDDFDDLGKDLTPEEMKLAQLAIGVVSETVAVIKELIRSITGLLKKGDLGDNNGVDSLERLLQLCRSVGVLVDELGAGLYPPQETSAIVKACRDLSSLMNDMQKELESLNGDVEAFCRGCEALKKAVNGLILEVSDSDDVELQLHSLTMKD